MQYNRHCIRDGIPLSDLVGSFLFFDIGDCPGKVFLPVGVCQGADFNILSLSWGVDELFSSQVDAHMGYGVSGNGKEDQVPGLDGSLLNEISAMELSFGGSCHGDSVFLIHIHDESGAVKSPFTIATKLIGLAQKGEGCGNYCVSLFPLQGGIRR